MFNLNNVCIFEGRLVADPQYGSFQGANGQVETAMFRIALDRSMTSEQRQKAKTDDTIKTADFAPCKLTGPKVAFLKQYFSKGSAIKVSCRYTDYKTKDQTSGADKYGYMFEVEEIGFTVSQQNQNGGGNGGNNNNAGGGGNGGTNSGNQSNGGGNNSQSKPTQAQQPSSNFELFGDEEMPF